MRGTVALAAGTPADLQLSTFYCVRRWVFPSRPHIWGLHSGAGRPVPFPRAILSAIFPDDCHICGCALTSFDSFPVCDSCVQKVKPIRADCFCERCGVPFLNQWALDEDGICRLCLTGRRGFDACFVFGSYEKELRDLIHLFKYGRIESLAAPLAAWMLAALPADRKINGRRADCVVPVPMHWWKRWRRGFNQAERLGQEVSRALSIPMVEALRRPKPSRVQAGLASAARRKNALRSFALSRSGEIAGKSVLLVDDVFTTGATATACARLLKRAGAERVELLALARVDRRAPAPFPRAHESSPTRAGWRSDETDEADFEDEGLPLDNRNTQGE